MKRFRLTSSESMQDGASNPSSMAQNRYLCLILLYSCRPSSACFKCRRSNAIVDNIPQAAFDSCGSAAHIASFLRCRNRRDVDIYPIDSLCLFCSENLSAWGPAVAHFRGYFCALCVAFKVSLTPLPCRDSRQKGPPP